MPNAAKRLDRLPPYIFVSIAEKIQRLTDAGHHVLRLDIGNPDMPPPDHVIEELASCAKNPDLHGYSGYRGISPFRQAVAQHYETRFGVSLDPETQVLPLIGSKEGIVNLTTAYVDVGDVVLVPEVGYPSYSMATLLAGGEVVYVQMNTQKQYRLRLSDIPEDAAQRAKILWVNSPNNPTGSVVDLSHYQELVDFCQENDVLLASDNPYVDVMYDGLQAGSALQAAGAIENAVEFMSFSKSYNMAGWRLGAAVGSADALKKLLHVKSNMDSGHFKPIYHAGIAALRDTPQEWIDQRNQIYEGRRDLILANLEEIGLTAPNKPGGAMYIWAKPLQINASDYVERALQEAHVSLAPGSAYGPGGTDFIRLSVGVPDDMINAALKRLKTWYATEVKS